MDRKTWAEVTNTKPVVFIPQLFLEKSFSSLYGQAITIEDATRISNAEVERWRETLQAVYEYKHSGCWDKELEKDFAHEYTHQARLAFIEEIKPVVCEHEPDHSEFEISGVWRCRKCNATLTPKWTAEGDK